MSVSLKEIIKVYYGKSLKAEERDESGEHFVFGSSGQVGKHNKFLCDYPTIIIGRKGSVGAVTYAPVKSWTIDTAFYVEIIDKEAVNLRYLFYALKNANLARHTITTSIPGVNRDDIYKTQIPLPPLPEQKRIAEVLDKADALREKRRLALQKLDTLLQSVFLEMFGDPVKNPKGWDIVPLSSITKEFRYGTSNKSSEEGFITLRIPNVVNQTLNLSDLKMVSVTPSEFERLKLLDGDVVFVRTNGNPNYVGRCAVFDKQEVEELGFSSDEFIYASYLIRARMDKDKIEPLFLQNYLLTQEGKKNLKSKCKTSAGQYNINTEGLGSIPILLPPISLQKEFVSQISKVAKLKRKIMIHQNHCENLFQSLQQRAFKGELFNDTFASAQPQEENVWQQTSLF